MAITPAERARDGAALRAPDPEPDVGRSWYLFLISGAVSAVVGVLVLAYPDPSVKLLGVFLGIDLLAVGVLLIVRGVSKDVDADSGAGALMLGTLTLIAGLIAIRNPAESLVLLVVAFAAYLIVTGALALGHGLVHRDRRWASVGRGLLLVAAGTVLISWPDVGARTLAVIAGITLVLQGALEVGEAFVLRSLGRSTERA